MPLGRLAMLPRMGSGLPAAFGQQPVADRGRVVTQVPADAERGGSGSEVAPLVHRGHRNAEELGHLA